MRVRLALPFVVAPLLGCVEPSRVSPTSPAPMLVREDPSDRPIEGLTPTLLLEFARGDALFDAPFTDTQGLGPHYIQRSCVGCHEDDARGPGVVQRFVAPALFPFGDTVRPRRTSLAHTAIAAPEGARISTRLPPAVFARGWMEAIDDATLRGWAESQARANGPITGRVSELAIDTAPPSLFGDRAPRLGRFGHKARTATLEDFVVDALIGDMGLTSSARPSEPPNPDALSDDAHEGIDLDDPSVSALATYVRLLAIPPRAAPDARAVQLFTDVGCHGCHVMEARTRGDHPIEALRDREVALYTDMLLHDLGEGLADGPAERTATDREWRTAPLVGLRFFRAFLHDGRAEDVASAIAAHASEGSEANEVIARFDALSDADRAALVSFVESL